MSIFGKIKDAIFGSAKAKEFLPRQAPPRRPRGSAATAGAGGGGAAAAAAPAGGIPPPAAATPFAGRRRAVNPARRAEQAEARLAEVHRRPDEATRPRQQP